MFFATPKYRKLQTKNTESCSCILQVFAELVCGAQRQPTAAESFPVLKCAVGGLNRVTTGAMDIKGLLYIGPDQAGILTIKKSSPAWA